MISLEEEARITNRSEEFLARHRRFDTSIRDCIKDMAGLLFGSFGVMVTSYAADYYYPEDMINVVACSGLTLLATGVVLKSLYNLGRFVKTRVKSIAKKDDRILNEYLERKYPNANRLQPVFVDDFGKPRD